jgi:hypothetical protein
VNVNISTWLFIPESVQFRPNVVAHYRLSDTVDNGRQCVIDVTILSTQQRHSTAFVDLTLPLTLIRLSWFKAKLQLCGFD